MRVLGIDPGKSGGVAHIEAFGSQNASVGTFAMPSTVSEIRSALQALKPVDRCFIEKVGPTRGPEGRRQGATSMFNFGFNLGVLHGILTALDISFEEVAPQKWCKEFGLKRAKDESQTSWKNRHKDAASKLFPGFKVTHATADALLIAEYGARIFTGTLRKSA